MQVRFFITQIVLWLFVIFAGMVAGGSIFESFVITPLWDYAPPESVHSFQYMGIQGEFFKIFTPLYGLFSLILIIVCWLTPREQKIWAFIAGFSGIAAVASTFWFFLPIVIQLQQNAGLSDDEIVRLVNQWHSWQWLRQALVIGGWFAGLRALSLSRNEKIK